MNSLKATDIHIAQFSFKEYPDLPKEYDSSPRIIDDTWQKYKKLS